MQPRMLYNHRACASNVHADSSQTEAIQSPLGDAKCSRLAQILFIVLLEQLDAQADASTSDTVECVPASLHILLTAISSCFWFILKMSCRMQCKLCRLLSVMSVPLLARVVTDDSVTINCSAYDLRYTSTQQRFEA